MAERDYALEMWRLLDPEAHLIGLKQLRDRVFCVKSGKGITIWRVFHKNSSKSLLFNKLDLPFNEDLPEMPYSLIFLLLNM